MPRSKGVPKTGGRQKGSRNKAGVTREIEIAKSGLLPLDYMLQVMRDPNAEFPRRDDMAKAAAPYIHKRMPQAIEGGDPNKPLQVQSVGDTELARRIALILMGKD